MDTILRNILKLFFPSFFSTESRHPWRAIRMQGGGMLNSPRDMTEEEACEWVSHIIKGEIAYIDRECGFIFYRPKE
jgi:hypothetical protein